MLWYLSSLRLGDNRWRCLLVEIGLAKVTQSFGWQMEGEGQIADSEATMFFRPLGDLRRARYMGTYSQSPAAAKSLRPPKNRNPRKICIGIISENIYSPIAP